MIPQITVIIPFKNEGEEVDNTLRSITEKAEGSINIILINDNSDDNYDYCQIANKYNALYVANQSSLGVAPSREIGIALCKTEYFLILDAHMRLFTQNWDKLLCDYLINDHRSIFCFTTLDIKKNGEVRTQKKGYGVTLNLNNLSYNWICQDLELNNIKSSYVIPCIMGGAYASNIEYWNRINGLKGLNGFGFDEQLISLKTFFEGGNCKVITDIEFGHIFREYKDVPYNIDHSEVIYNQLYITELLFPLSEKISFFHQLKTASNKMFFDKAIDKIIDRSGDINHEKEYMNKIFIKKFNDYCKFNNNYNLADN